MLSKPTWLLGKTDGCEGIAVIAITVDGKTEKAKNE